MDHVENKMTAHIVSRGAYSDYRVIAVFTDKEKADKYAENANDALNKENDWSRFRVEKQPLNPEPEEYSKYAWAEVKKDGEVKKKFGSRNIGASGTTKNTHKAYKRTKFQESTSREEAAVVVTIPGHDTDKAIRKAREIAEKAQEEGWWGDDEKLKQVLKEQELGEEL